MLAGILIVAGLRVESACAQLGVPWRHAPKITVVSAGGDSRLRAVDEAVAFWNTSGGDRLGISVSARSVT
jgi:hypothetical protein